jgi:hypothetical protein
MMTVRLRTPVCEPEGAGSAGDERHTKSPEGGIAAR